MAAIDGTPNYKEITQYLKNELGINREYIDTIIERSMANSIKHLLEQKLTPAFIEKHLGDAIKNTILDKSTTYYTSKSLHEKFQEAILRNVKIAVGNILEKELAVSFLIKPVVAEGGISDAAEDGPSS